MARSTITQRRRVTSAPVARRPRGSTFAAALFGLAVLLIVAGAIGVVNAAYGYLAITAAVAVLFVGLASTDIGLIPVIVFPATLLMMRTGPLSVSDLVLAAGTLPAVVLYRSREAGEVRQLLWLGFVYQAMLIPTLLLNPYGDNVQEWVHEGFLVLASLVIGWVVGRRGQHRTAINLYVLGSLGIAVATVFQGGLHFAQGQGLGGVYLPYLHKNFIGNSLAFAFLMVFVRPDWMGWPARLARWMLIVLGAGVVFSGARQSLVSVAVAIAILALRSRQAGGGKARVLLLLAVPALWYVTLTVIEQINSGNDFNSSSQRLVWFRDSLSVWADSPLFGFGLRWWYRPDAPFTFQPPNAFLEMLTSAGVVGLAGFLILCIGALWVVFRLDPRYGNIALVVMVARFTQGQLDLYWVAGQSSFLWLMAGLAYGVQALHRYGPHRSRWASQRGAGALSEDGPRGGRPTDRAPAERTR